MNKELLEVRYAYRLISAFQERLLDTVRFLSEQFEGRTFYHNTHPIFVRLPRGGTSPFGLPTETFLPLFGASLLFAGDEVDHHLVLKGRWLLEIQIAPDTANIRAINNDGSFKSEEGTPEESDSVIKLIAWKCVENLPAGSNWLFQVWTDLNWPTQVDFNTPATIVQMDGKIVSTVITRSMTQLTTRDEIVAFAHEAKLAFKDILEN